MWWQRISASKKDVVAANKCIEKERGGCKKKHRKRTWWQRKNALKKDAVAMKKVRLACFHSTPNQLYGPFLESRDLVFS